MTSSTITRLARRRSCPYCDRQKTEGNALCRHCRFKLPAHMRQPLEGIAQRDRGVVSGALRAAANYFSVHFKSVRLFGGGRPRS